jgi:hypothetical protein
MNDKDKEAFEKWELDYFGKNDNCPHYMLHIKNTWQAACEYKQREITLLENEISYLEETIDDFMDEPDIEIKRLQAENKKLREALGFYADNWFALWKKS